MKNFFYIASVFFSVLMFPFKSEAAELERMTTWKGTVSISEKITVPSGGILKIQPGTKVIFHENGEMLCKNGTLDAEGAEFEADYRSEKHFFNFKSSKVKFKDCVFRNMYPGKAHFSYNRNKSFFFMFYGSLTMTGCAIDKSSGIHLVWLGKALIEDNSFSDIYQRALTLQICRNSVICRNSFNAGKDTTETILLNCVENSSIIMNRFQGKAIALIIRGKSHHNNIIANSIFMPSTGIHVDGPAWNNIFLSNLVYKPSSTAFNFKESGKSNLILNCVSWGSEGVGFSIGKTEGIILRNSVSANGKYGIVISNNAQNPLVEYNLVWNNKYDKKGALELLKSSKNIVADPLFADPENANFRPRAKFMEYPDDSVLIGSGFPQGSNIGLYPGGFHK
ncbi:MAG: hypothetical protein A2017_09175 [Lentisphaerae bacterium GWF2_44_16]|nr:MAG: hypothetical protein A2017_09175 [Lentisphaerae bacterium GWF2_44_16]